MSVYCWVFLLLRLWPTVVCTDTHQMRHFLPPLLQPTPTYVSCPVLLCCSVSSDTLTRRSAQGKWRAQHSFNCKEKAIKKWWSWRFYCTWNKDHIHRAIKPKFFHIILYTLASNIQVLDCSISVLAPKRSSVFYFLISILKRKFRPLYVFSDLNFLLTWQNDTSAPSHYIKYS